MDYEKSGYGYNKFENQPDVDQNPPPYVAGPAPQAYSMPVVVGPPPVGQTVIIQSPRVPNHMAIAILACLCCFWPTGIAAIYFATKVDEYNGLGNVEEALKASKNVKILSIVSLVLGIVIGIIVGIVWYFLFYQMVYDSYPAY